MSQDSPESSVFELHGGTTDVTYRPGERLEVRDESGERLYSADGLTVEPVSLGLLVTAQLGPAGEPDATFSLLLSRVPYGGGPVSALAITARPRGGAWTAVAMQGQAGANATSAARAAAVRSVSRPGAADVHGERPGPVGKAAAIAGVASAFSIDVAVDKLISPDSADAATLPADSGSDLPVPDGGLTVYAHLEHTSALDDDPAESESEEEEAPHNPDDFLGGLDLPHGLI